MLADVLIWGGYIALFIWLSRKGSGHDVMVSGRVGFGIQAFAYVATYISAVALVGFGGLAYAYGMQMLLVAAGNVWLGTWIVYRYLAWPTRLCQRNLQARTPVQLLANGHRSPLLGRCLALIFAVFLGVYAFVMLVGICMLTVAVFDKVGGPVEGMARLAELAPTATANTGFVSLADGGQGWFIISLVIVTSVAVWAQPQMIQRQFALNSARQVNRITPLAMLVLTVLVGGAYYVASLARLFMPEVASPDDVMPALVKMLLPDIGLQLFVLAIVSASLSTATAIFHIAVAAIAEDLPGRKTSRGMWFAGIVFCVLLSGGCAQIKGQIIAMLCTTSWSIVGSTVLVAYVALVRFGKRSSLAAWCSCAAGFVSCMLWYLMTHPQFAILPMPWPSLAALPPFFVGFAFSLAGWGLGWALDGEGRRNSSFWPAGMKPGM